MLSQVGRTFSRLRKSFPCLGGHFPRFGNRFRMSMISLCAALHTSAPLDRLGGGFDIYFQLCGPVKAHGSFVSKASSVPPSRQ